MDVEAGRLPPFIKWAGGKRWLIQRYASLLPSSFNRYYEPFLGSASTFFFLRPNCSLLSDQNAELIKTYRAIRDNWVDVELHLSHHAAKHGNEYYYHIRERTPATDAEIAARLIYLNRTCWNGLYRVNLNGKFNVPRGTKDRVLVKTDNFALIAEALSESELLESDFEAALDKSHAGDFAFVDPPYTTAHNLNGFVKYNKRIFDWNDQIRLRDVIVRAASRGVKILVTNANHESVRTLYNGVGKHSILDRKTVISGALKGRKETTELAIVIGY